MKRGLITQIAKKAGVSQPYTTQIINGSRKLDKWSVAKKLAEASGTEPVLWLEGTPEEIRAAVALADKRTRESDADFFENWPDPAHH